tara:strand:+ start:127 stop:396 length:270 start_codon:yes stop_codon:yes gene_type:complete
MRNLFDMSTSKKAPIADNDGTPPETVDQQTDAAPTPDTEHEFPTISAQTAFSRRMLERYEKSKPFAVLPFQKKQKERTEREENLKELLS